MRHFFLFILLFISTALSAQVPFFQHYALVRQKDLLQVNDIHQDRKGYIWLATSKGLFRFDGKQHIQFTIKDSLPDNHVTTVAEDADGRIWTGYRTGSIAIYEGGKFTKFDPEEGTSSEPISDILFAKNGDMWFGTLNDGLYYFHDNRVFRLDEQEGMPDLYIYDIVEDRNGNILAGTDGGVAVCKTGQPKVSISVMDYKSGLPDNIIRKIAEGENGKLWMGTEDAGVILYDPQVKTFQPVPEKWSYGPVSDFIVKGDEIWIACPQTGLIVHHISTGQSSVFTEVQVPGTASINVLLNDTEGNIWSGSRSGLLRTPGTGIQFINGFTSQDEANILAVTVDKAKNIWYSNKRGLFRTGVDGDSDRRTTAFLAGTPYADFTVISLFTDSAGFVWAGLYGEGVLRIDPKSGKIMHLSRELRNGNVLNITGRGNVIWLATLGGGTRITTSSGNVAVENFGREEGLSSDFIYQVFLDDRNRVWFATDGKGVDVLDGTKFQHFEQGLPTKIVYSITQDKQKRMWVNAQASGIYYFDETNKLFRAAPPQLALRESEIHALTTDRNGNLVVLHDSGIDVINVADTTVHYFGDETGLRDKIGNLNTQGRDGLDDLYFGTNNGIVRYAVTPDHLQRTPEPQIGTVKVFDKVVDTTKLAELSYDENNLTFNFVGIWYQNPEQVHFLYKLENYDLDWIETRNTSVTYSHLPPGSYTFRVRAAVTDDFTRGKETLINISVNPPFWRTPSFYMLSFFSIVIGLYAFIRFRERKLKRDKMMLEATVRRRTMEVQRQNDEIQAQNEEIMAQAEEIKGINENLEQLVQERTNELERKNKALEEYAFINAHKLRSPVASILGLVNLIGKTKLDEDGKEINQRLQQAADELDNIVRSITKAIEKGEKQPFR